MAVMDTMNIEARASLLHVSAEAYDSETLSEGEALTTLLTKLYIIEDLTVCRRRQIRGREPSGTGFNVATEMSRAVSMREYSTVLNIRSTSPKMYWNNGSEAFFEPFIFRIEGRLVRFTHRSRGS